MFDALTDSRFGIWIVAAAITLVDSALLLEPGKFPYRIRNDKSPPAVVTVPSHAFAIRNKNFVLTLLTSPCLLLHISDVRAPLQTTAHLYRTIKSLQRLQRQFAFLSVSALCALTLVFTGPLLAAFYGQTLAILIVAGFLYPMALVAGTFICLRWRIFQLSRSTAFLYVAELMLCPILIINLGKKIGANIQPNVNTFQIVGDEASKRTAIEENLSFFGISPQSTSHELA